MIIEKNVLRELVEKYIDTDCGEFSAVNDMIKFKTYLKKDDNNCFVVVDKEHSIKCLFDKEFVNQYFSTYPSSTTLDQYDGMLIMVKKALFDVLFYKNINKTVSYRVVLCIMEFELDNAQKMNIGNYNARYPNVNFVPKIEEKMNGFYYNYIRNQLKDASDRKSNLNHHFSVNAHSFINKRFNRERDYWSIRKVLPRGCSLTFLHNKRDAFAFLDDESSFIIKEIEVKDNQILKDNSIEDDNINVENLKKLDFKSLLYKQPSREDKSLKGVSLFQKVDLSLPLTEPEKNLGNKRERESDKTINDMPINIQNLINKMEHKPPITLGLFEKYKNYKKGNFGEYTRDKI